MRRHLTQKRALRLLQNAGVDLTDKRSIASALEVFERGVDELAELLK